MLNIKELCVTSPSMLQADFMWGVVGRGGIFNVDIKTIPDYSDDWGMLSVANKRSSPAAIRLSCDKSLDMFLEPEERRLILTDSLKG